MSWFERFREKEKKTQETQRQEYDRLFALLVQDGDLTGRHESRFAELCTSLGISPEHPGKVADAIRTVKGEPEIEQAIATIEEHRQTMKSDLSAYRKATPGLIRQLEKDRAIETAQREQSIRQSLVALGEQKAKLAAIQEMKRLYWRELGLSSDAAEKRTCYHLINGYGTDYFAKSGVQILTLQLMFRHNPWAGLLDKPHFFQRLPADQQTVEEFEELVSLAPRAMAGEFEDAAYLLSSRKHDYRTLHPEHQHLVRYVDEIEERLKRTDQANNLTYWPKPWMQYPGQPDAEYRRCVDRVEKARAEVENRKPEIHQAPLITA